MVARRSYSGLVGLDRLRWTAAAAIVTAVLVAACADEETPAGPTLPPIATTTTLPPPTTANVMDQDRFYVIRQGDILSRIAQRYQVSQDDLMAKNGITDPDAISVGQVLELPDGAVLPVDSTPP